MNYTIISKNSQDESKLIVAHITISKGESVANAIKSIGRNPENVVVLRGKHYALLPDELS